MFATDMATPRTFRESQKAAALLAARARRTVSPSPATETDLRLCTEDFSGYTEMARGMMFVAEYALAQLADAKGTTVEVLAAEIAVKAANRLEDMRHLP